MSTERSVVYIDIDDEITSIIEKVKSADKRIVAVVLPKRAAVLQSIVNMKLLSRAADQSKKRLVLVTTEAGLLPLAGAVGLHTASTLNSKPAIPAGPPEESAADADTALSEPDDVPLDSAKPVGDLAGIPLAPSDDEETIEIDNSTTGAAMAAAGAKSVKNKKLKIPNFESFRLRLFLGIGVLILLIILWFFGSKVLPKSQVTIQTKTSNIDNDLTFTARSNAKELDIEQKIIPAGSKKIDKTANQKVPATGKKDVGTKATGNMTLVNCNKDDETLTVPARTEVSTDSLTFITSDAAVIPPSNFTGGGVCKNDSSKTVAVVAQNPGSQYNLSARPYTVSGFTSISGSGSAMTGGTTKVITVVSAQDVQSARDKLGDESKAPTADELKAALAKDSLLPIPETYSAAEPTVTPTPAIDSEASEVTVTVAVSSTMVGIKADALNSLIKAVLDKQIDTSKQTIVNNGVQSGVFRVVDKPNPDNTVLNLKSLVQIGPKLDEAEIKRMIGGQKRGPAESLLSERPGIQEARVDFSPFWVNKVPTNPAKVKIVIKQANGSSQ